MAKPTKEENDNHSKNNDAQKMTKEETQAAIKAYREAQEAKKNDKK